jgi:hypothetical protein
MRMLQGWLGLWLLAVLAPAGAMTADELVAKNIEAKGGLAKMRAIESSRTVGKMQFTGDFAGELAMSQVVTRSGKLRQEGTLQGLTQISAWDGKEGWQIQPFGGRKDPEKLSADDTKGLVDDADIDGALVDWKAKGHRAEYLGIEDVDGTEAHKLKLTLKNGDVKTYWFDPDYFLEIRIRTKRTIRGAEQEFEMDLGDYEEVAGVFMPFAYEMGQPNGPKGTKLTVEKIEVNIPVDDAQFAFPATATK